MHDDGDNVPVSGDRPVHITDAGHPHHVPDTDTELDQEATLHVSILNKHVTPYQPNYLLSHIPAFVKFLTHLRNSLGRSNF